MRARLVLLMLLPVVGLLVYWKGLAGGFVFDDFPNLVEDPDWKLVSLDWPSLVRVVSSGITSDFGRPLALLSFALNHYFTGMNPVAMKASGLALHLVNTVLVYGLVLALVQRAWAAAAPRADAVAGLLACLWMVHPLQVSTVLYVVQRMELGACTGVLVALLCYLRARAGSQRGWRAFPWWCGVAAGTLLGLGFKETALLVPGYTLMLEVFILKFADRQGRRQWWLVGGYAIGATAAAAVFLLKVLPVAMEPATYAARDFSLVERMLTQAPVLLHYLKQILLPWPESLSFYYDNFPVHSGLDAGVVWSWICLVALVLLAWCLRHRWPLLSLGVGWFLVAHALTSNVYPLELVFEHRNYFALFGVLLALAQPMACVLRPLGTGARLLLLGALLTFVATMGFVQVLSWSDPARLAMTMATRNPDSPRAGYEFGRILLAAANDDVRSPAWSLAEKEFEHAAGLPGNSPLAEQAVIIMAAHAGHPAPPDAWAGLERKLTRRALGPQQFSALEAIVECQASRRCPQDGMQVLMQLLPRLTQTNPASARIRAIYANYAFNVLSDPQLAMLLIREAAALSPQDIGYRIWLVRMGLASNLLESKEARSALGVLVAADNQHAYGQDIQALRQWLATQR